MDNQLTTTLASTVLSSSSGLRAYLPLFALGIGALTGVIPLESGYQILTNPVILAVLGLLSVLEIVADKFPAVDHISDVIHTVIRPVMGAVIFSGTNNLVSAHSSILAAGIGVVLAGSVHGLKALSRPVVTATTVGFGNPVVSLIEDIAVVGFVVLAILIPILAVILLVLFVLLFILIVRAIWRRLRRRKRQQGAMVDAGRARGVG